MWGKLIIQDIEQSDAGKQASELMEKWAGLIEAKRRRGFSARAIAQVVLAAEASLRG